MCWTIQNPDVSDAFHSPPAAAAIVGWRFEAVCDIISTSVAHAYREELFHGEVVAIEMFRLWQSKDGGRVEEGQEREKIVEMGLMLAETKHVTLFSTR